MIADLKPYVDYKDSGLPWIGQVPARWGLVPNRGLIRKRKVLVGKASWFLPFNMGHNDVAGNPPNPHGLKT